jgi:hypothetical protein
MRSSFGGPMPRAVGLSEHHSSPNNKQSPARDAPHSREESAAAKDGPMLPYNKDLCIYAKTKPQPTLHTHEAVVGGCLAAPRTEAKRGGTDSVERIHHKKEAPLYQTPTHPHDCTTSQPRTSCRSLGLSSSMGRWNFLTTRSSPSAFCRT